MPAVSLVGVRHFALPLDGFTTGGGLGLEGAVRHAAIVDRQLRNEPAHSRRQALHGQRAGLPARFQFGFGLVETLT